MSSFQFLHIGKNNPKGPWHIDKHSHHFYEIILILRSSETIDTNNTKIKAEVGDVLFFCPGVSHEEWSDGNQELETLFIGFQSSEPIKSVPLVIKDTQGRLRILASWILQETINNPKHKPAKLLNQFFDAFMAEMMRILEHKDAPLVEMIRNLIVNNPDKKHSLESLAKKANLSKFHFLRKYTEQAGVSPVEDVRRIRLQIARNLILTTSEPLKSIAQKAGLKNEMTLCRLFQKTYQHTPGQLRQ